MDFFVFDLDRAATALHQPPPPYDTAELAATALVDAAKRGTDTHKALRRLRSGVRSLYERRTAQVRMTLIAEDAPRPVCPPGRRGSADVVDCVFTVWSFGTQHDSRSWHATGAVSAVRRPDGSVSVVDSGVGTFHVTGTSHVNCTRFDGVRVTALTAPRVLELYALEMLGARLFGTPPADPPALSEDEFCRRLGEL